MGYATGQFGKNHLGDRNEHLPTVHGFDEFFGNLYHLNAEEEPENIDYPSDPGFKGRFGPRGVLRCYATALEEAGEDPRFGAWGKQRCEDTGPLTAERMETVDREFLTAAEGFIDKAHQANQPFFVWYNSTRMHIWTHLQDRLPRARPGSASTPTAWSSTTAWSASCWPSSTSSASPTTRSSCTRPTTVPRR